MQTIDFLPMDFLRCAIGVILFLMLLTGFICFVKMVIKKLQERRWRKKIKVRQVFDEIDWGIDEPCLN